MAIVAQKSKLTSGVRSTLIAAVTIGRCKTNSKTFFKPPNNQNQGYANNDGGEKTFSIGKRHIGKKISAHWSVKT